MEKGMLKTVGEETTKCHHMVLLRINEKSKEFRKNGATEGDIATFGMNVIVNLAVALVETVKEVLLDHGDRSKDLLEGLREILPEIQKIIDDYEKKVGK